MRKQWLILSMAAGLIVSAGCKSMDNDHADKESEEHETKMNFTDVPQPVRQTLMTAAPGANIKTVDHEMHKGMMVYEADAMVGGQNWEILVSEDGKLISKKLDDEASEKGEKSGKDEKDEDEAKEKK